MKYIIDIPDEYENDYISMSPLVGKEFCYPIRNMNKTYIIPTGLKIEPYTEPDRKAIEDEVWKLARLIVLEAKDGGLKRSELYECFRNSSIQEVMKTHSYQEAKAKYDEWKNQKEEIRVGDEVETESGNKACVLYENSDGTQMFVFKADGTAAWWSKCAIHEIHKTGKNHPEVAELLKKMREETE